MQKEEMIKKVKELNFPQGQYIVVGSGGMIVHNIKESHDIDIVVAPELFNKCLQEDWDQIPRTYLPKIGQIFLRRNDIELYLDVNCGNFNPTLEELLERAEIIEEIPFASLQDILQFKIAYNTPKHAIDIEKIKGYLKNKQ